MKGNVITLMQRNAKLRSNYRWVERCFKPNEDGYVWLLPFAEGEGCYKPRNKVEKKLLKELKEGKPNG